MNQLQSLRGMVDILPMQIQHWQAVELVAREQFHRAGFKEIRTPLLEVTELFSRSIGEATDVVGKEMYTFSDRGNRSCTLRPEGTASVVRAVVEHGLLSKGLQRFWYGGPMFRYERPQAGRQRQFHQIGVECLGIDSPRCDVEVIAMAWDLLHSLGLNDLVLELNSLGTPEDRKKYRVQLLDWLHDRRDQLDVDSQKRLQTNPLRILDSKDPKTCSLLKDAPLLEDSLCNESSIRFESLKHTLEVLGIPFALNPRLVRGLDYYCHTAFEITSRHLGAQATVCGGGRYDGLVEQLGGPASSGIGWAIGMERLVLLLDDSFKAASSPDVYFVNKGEEAEIKALDIARRLRAAGLAVELDSSRASFGKQFRRADRCGAKWAIILGDDEMSNGEVRLKKLHSTNDPSIVKELVTSSSDLDGLLAFLRS
ncbi:histidine--tRNA ligase [Prochlorococcus sp. MIT 1307]|uniref:histidine--tRNA ligase n=1 Tax=Prochlorococcus sp. MIT 1307 TaxID=3096219 RepID=UPI002A760C47|nr:histidine--tRNA ligase [Prochlorococcus sp. MIT 1307]